MQTELTTPEPHLLFALTCSFHSPIKFWPRKADQPLLVSVILWFCFGAIRTFFVYVRPLNYRTAQRHLFHL